MEMTIIQRSETEVTIEREDGCRAIVDYESVLSRQDRDLLAYARILDESDWIPA